MTAAREGTRLSRNAGLDLLRALAIVLTFFVHFVWVMGGWLYQRDFEMLAVREANSLAEGVLIWLAHSQHGVFLFFVLSGYLMGRKWFANADLSAARFFRDRAFRTLPGAWLAVLCALLFLAGSAHWPADPIARYLENAFFLNWFRKDDSRALLVVTWSLHAEWLFYLSLPLIAACAQRFAKSRPALGVLLIALAICVALKFLSLRGAAYAWFFAVGVIVAIRRNDWRAHIKRIPWPVIFISYVGVNFTYAWFSASAARLQTAFWNPFDTHAILFGLTAGALLLKLLHAEFADALWVRTGRYVAQISYSIYLWHLLVILAVGRWMQWPQSLETFGAPIAVIVYTSAVLFLTWLVSALSFALIERPYFERKRTT